MFAVQQRVCSPESNQHFAECTLQTHLLRYELVAQPLTVL